VYNRDMNQGLLEDAAVRLSVSREGKLAADFQFDDGPVYIVDRGGPNDNPG